MAFEQQNFKEAGGPGNSLAGGQIYSVFSETDSLLTMLESGYLNAVRLTINIRDFVFISGTDGVVLTQVSSQVLPVNLSTLSVIGPVQAITNSGAIDTISPTTDMTTTGASAFTLADGFIGQKKTITLVAENGTATLIPATRLGYASITFDDAGDSVQLEFKSGGWAVLGQGGVGTGPQVV